MKFMIDGREYEDYQLSNEQIVELLEGDNEVTDMGHDFLMKKVYERFKSGCCARKGEGRDELFARNFSDYVNRCPNDFKKAAKKMSCDHRYLQSEMFKVFMEYIKILAENFDNGFYDDRNEYACATSKAIIEYFEKVGYPF